MRRSIRLAAATAALLLVFPVATVQATKPLAVHFEVPTTFDENTFLSGGQFTATGPAVEADLVCPTGDATDVAPAKASGYQSGRLINLQVVKQFTCEDGSGTFLVKLQVNLRFGLQTTDTFNWTVVGGADRYARLHGTGSGYGDYAAYPDGVLDVYDGAVH
jgi:hypothetical protein